mmetsp:Transcript_39286/g.111249  ORF Transcript_39286/g.111249 Transcript_39286/m.111249 type:complete len:270 (+) Transcript_39286:577-1386(+)
MHPAVAGPGALREEQERAALVREVPALLQRFHLAPSLVAHQRHVPREEHAPAYERDEEIAELGDEFEVPIQVEQCVYVQVARMVGHIDGRLVVAGQVLLPFDLHSVEERGADLCPNIVHHMLSSALVLVKNPHEGEDSHHHDEQRDSADKGGEIKHDCPDGCYEAVAHRVCLEASVICREGGSACSGRAGGCHVASPLMVLTTKHDLASQPCCCCRSWPTGAHAGVAAPRHRAHAARRGRWRRNGTLGCGCEGTPSPIGEREGHRSSGR